MQFALALHADIDKRM